MDAWSNIQLTMVQGRLSTMREDAAARRTARWARMLERAATAQLPSKAEPTLRPAVLNPIGR